MVFIIFIQQRGLDSKSLQEKKIYIFVKGSGTIL